MPATWTTLAVAGLAAGAPLSGAEAAREAPAIAVSSCSGPVSVDGDLSDAAWQGAARVDTFYEYNPGDNTPPPVRTVAWVTYDSQAFYVAVQADDPRPELIRAPIVERDEVLGDQDNVALLLDTRGDRRAALQFRVNPRGVQTDAVVYDATGTEDYAPDFFYDAAARVTPSGWSAEFRIPLRSLRFKAGAEQPWGLLVIRNYPRDFRRQFASVRLPRESNCLICFAAALTGLHDLPSSGGLVAAPYVAAADVASAARPGAPLVGRAADTDVGLDVKWTPSADLALDATLNPDFSQVESDVAQIVVNTRFAVFFSEKRPFFLEGVDLFETPIAAVYTRTLTSPRWGARATGRLGSSSYTLLAADDAGGGGVILPGPTGSSLAPQDLPSWAGIARVRHELGRSFVGFLAAAREIEGGGHNRVFGPDFQWRPDDHNRLTGQLLWSGTHTPVRPALAAEWDGRRLGAHAFQVQWSRWARKFDWRVRYGDVGSEFRADLGFVPQVGYRRYRLAAGYNAYPERGLFNRLHPLVEFEQFDGRSGGLISRRIAPALDFYGKRNLYARLSWSEESLRTGRRVLDRAQGTFYVAMNLSRGWPLFTLFVVVGEDTDIDNERVGRGAEIRYQLSLRPNDHLTLDADGAVGWLNVDPGEGLAPTGVTRTAGVRERLFTARVLRLKATWNFSPRAALRLIGQHVNTTRDPTLYAFPVPRRAGRFGGSALFTYRLNWQTALFAGYGDERALDDFERLRPTGRAFFVKLSYAFQR